MRRTSRASMVRAFCLRFGGFDLDSCWGIPVAGAFRALCPPHVGCLDSVCRRARSVCQRLDVSARPSARVSAGGQRSATVADSCVPTFRRSADGCCAACVADPCVGKPDGTSVASPFDTCNQCSCVGGATGGCTKKGCVVVEPTPSDPCVAATCPAGTQCVAAPKQWCDAETGSGGAFG